MLVLIYMKGHLFAQDPIFAQFYANPLYLNPALAGAEQCPRINLNYRNEWSGLNSTVYATYAMSYDQNIDAIHGGVGLLITHDIAGPGQLTTNNISGIYSYRLQVTQNFTLSVGLQGTWWQKSINWSHLSFGDMIDARQGFIYNTQTNTSISNSSGIDLSSGIVGSSKYFFAGVAMDHLTQPNQGFLVNSYLPYKFTGHMGTTIPLSDKEPENGGISLSPNLVFQQQGNFHELNLGMYFNYSVLVAGLWYHTGDGGIALIGLKFKRWKIGLSCDVSSSQQGNIPATEFSFGMLLGSKTKIKAKRFQKVNCPAF